MKCLGFRILLCSFNQIISLPYHTLTLPCSPQTLRETFSFFTSKQHTVCTWGGQASGSLYFIVVGNKRNTYFSVYFKGLTAHWSISIVLCLDNTWLHTSKVKSCYNHFHIILFKYYFSVITHQDSINTV